MEESSISQSTNINFHDEVELKQVLPCTPLLSSRSLNWSGLVLDYYSHPPHEIKEHYAQQHIIAVTLSERVDLHQRIEKNSVYSSMKQGDLIVCPAGFERWCAWEQQADFLMLSIEQSVLAEACYQTGDTRQLELVPQLRIQDRVLQHLGITLMNEVKSCHSGDRFCIDSLLHLLYFHLLRHHTTSNFAQFPMPSHPSKRQFRKVIEYMQANIHKQLDLMEIAAFFNTTSYELTLLFLDITGLTPYQYLMRCRIERAKQLLTSKQLSTKEIAAQIGFATLHQFNSQFLQLVGVSPNVYRTEYAL